MKIYLSSGWNDHELVIAHAEALVKDGFTLAHDWPYEARALKKQGAPPGGGAGGDKMLPNDVRRALALSEMIAIDQADVFWLLAPSYAGAPGSWFEIGYAYAVAAQRHSCSLEANDDDLLQPPLRLVASGENAKRTIFTSGPLVRLFEAHEEAAAAIRTLLL